MFKTHKGGLIDTATTKAFPNDVPDAVTDALVTGMGTATGPRVIALRLIGPQFSPRS